jgi:hypothetical protein
MEKEEIQPKRLAPYLKEGMDRERYTIRTLAVETFMVYESVRKYVNGETLPSLQWLKLACDLLDMDFDRARKLRDIDELITKYGLIPPELIDQHPASDTEWSEWLDLKADQKAAVRTTIHAWASENRQKSMSASG